MVSLLEEEELNGRLKRTTNCRGSTLQKAHLTDESVVVA